MNPFSSSSVTGEGTGSIVKRMISSLFGTSRLAPQKAEKEVEMSESALNETQPAATNEEEKVDYSSMSKIIDPNNPESVIIRGVRGTVKWFTSSSRYGFIQREDIDQDVYVHVTGLVQHSPRHCQILEPGQEVEFDIVAGFKGVKAVGVTLVGGLPIKSEHTVSMFNPRRVPKNLEKNAYGKTKRDLEGKNQQQKHSNEQEKKDVDVKANSKPNGQKKRGGRQKRSVAKAQNVGGQEKEDLHSKDHQKLSVADVEKEVTPATKSNDTEQVTV